MRLKIAISLLLAGVTLAIFWPARHFEMIDFDDAQFINIDTAMRLNWQGLAWAMTAVVVANWHPVTTFSFLLTHQLFGINPGAEHMLNVAFHAANAALLFLVVAGLTGKLWRSAVVAAIFAWHPLRVESVAWIAERKDVFFLFFMLLSLLCYERYARPQGNNDLIQAEGAAAPVFRPWNPYYILALGFFVLSFMSKAMVVTMPFLLLLLDFWPLQRFSRITARGVLVEKIPFFALAIFFSWLTFQIQNMGGAVIPLEQISVLTRMENAVLSYINYLGELFWPAKLCIIYSFPEQIDGTEVVLDALLLLAISALCIRQIQRRPYLAVGWFWYLGTLVPVIGLVNVGGLAMADRYTYLPMIGPVTSLVWLAADWVATKSLWKPAAALVAMGIIGAGMALTRTQLMYWQNSYTLFEQAAEAGRANARVQISLATGLEQQGLLKQAAVRYRIGSSLAPIDYFPHFCLAVILSREGHKKAAMEEYRAAAACGCLPQDYLGNLNLGNSLIQLGRYGEAVAYLKAAVQLNPDSTQALNNLTWTLATCPDASARDGALAVQLGERACELTDYKQTIFIGTLAAAYAEAGRFDDAVATAHRAIALARQHGEAAYVGRNQELLQLYLAHKAYHEPEPSPGAN
jgi:tetratricopeptide (TPR) repeat protein